jgi:hypothetical protein
MESVTDRCASGVLQESSKSIRTLDILCEFKFVTIQFS